MFKYKDEDQVSNLNCNAKVYDIFLETKKIVYNTKTYNDYIKRTPSLGTIPDHSRKKTFSLIPNGDNFIHVSQSSLQIPKQLAYSHNSIKNREEHRYNGMPLLKAISPELKSDINKNQSIETKKLNIKYIMTL